MKALISLLTNYKNHYFTKTKLEETLIAKKEINGINRNCLPIIGNALIKSVETILLHPYLGSPKLRKYPFEIRVK